MRDQFVSAVKGYAADNKNRVPFGDLYETKDGTWIANSGRARPVVGGHLALVSSDFSTYRAALLRAAGFSVAGSAVSANEHYKPDRERLAHQYRIESVCGEHVRLDDGHFVRAEPEQQQRRIFPVPSA